MIFESGENNKHSQIIVTSVLAAVLFVVSSVLLDHAVLTFPFQLSDAISIIGREDFPQKWPDLLTEMVNRFQSGDFHVINGVLRTAHSLFKRYWRSGNCYVGVRKEKSV